jgi:hypothetical protein
VEKIPSETDNMLAAMRETRKKSHKALDFLLMMSAAVVIGALAVGMFIMVST